MLTMVTIEPDMFLRIEREVESSVGVKVVTAIER